MWRSLSSPLTDVDNTVHSLHSLHTSGKDSVGHKGRLHHPTPSGKFKNIAWNQPNIGPAPPDGGGDGGVTHGDDEGGDDEDGEGDQAHVDLPLPRIAEVYPALSAVF